MGQKRNPFKIVINRHLQTRCAVFVGCTVLSCLLFVWISLEIILLIYIKQYGGAETVRSVLNDVHFYFLYFFFWESLIVTSIAVLVTLMVSRRIAGPILRIQQALGLFLSHKKVKGYEFRIRNDDEFQDLGQMVGKFVEELQRQQEDNKGGD